MKERLIKKRLLNLLCAVVLVLGLVPCVPQTVNAAVTGGVCKYCGHYNTVHDRTQYNASLNSDSDTVYKCRTCDKGYAECEGHTWSEALNAPDHEHTIVYSSYNNTLISRCKYYHSLFCSLHDSYYGRADVNLSVSSVSYSGSAITKDTLFGGVDFSAFNDATGKNLSASDILIYAATDTAKTTPLDSINAEGSYVAVLTVESQTATLSFKVDYVPLHNWAYSANGATLTATCDKACGEATAHTATLTLSASSANYSGSAVEATMDKTAWEAAGLTAPSIVYEAKTGSALTDNKAVNVGSFTAKITAGDPAVTASVDFDIHGASTTYDSDDTNHWFTCALSGCTNTDETHKFNKATHSYDGTTHKCACGKIDPTYHQHVLGQKHDAVSGNCVDTGTIEYYDCAGTVGGACGKYLDAQGNELASIEGTKDATKHKGTATTWTKTETTHKETYDCCGAVKTEEANHTGGTATCQAKAKCSVCEMEYGEKANHAFATEFTEDTPATCTEKGSKSKHCTTAGCTETTEVTDIEPLGHTGGTVTCQAKAICTRCTKEYGDLAGHAYATEFTEDKAATCTEAGSKSKHCTTTGCTEKADVTPITALGHKYTSKVTKAATYAADGVRTYTCSNCGNKYTVVIPRLKITSTVKYNNSTKLDAGFKVTSSTKNVTVKWGKVADADGYIVYAAYCGKGDKAIKTIKGSAAKSYSFTKLNGKKLNLTKNIKAYVVAYKTIDGKKVKFGRTITAHIIGGKNKKFTNSTKVTIKKNKVTLAVNKTSTIKATVTYKDAKKKPISESHIVAKRYRSSNKAVATVDAKGKIKAVGKGTCTIYVFAQNGYSAKVTVTVK